MTKSRAAVVTAFAIGVLCVAWLFMRPGSTSRPVAPGPDAGAPPAALDGAVPPPPPSGLPIRLLAPQPAARDELPATFDGRVVSSATGQGVAGADLTFSRAGAAASVRAGADGAFSFAAPAPGRWLLAAVTAPGFLPFAPEWGHSPVQLDARPGLHVRGVELHLAPATELAGRVVDERGAPVAGARVRLLGTSGEAALVPLADRFTSGPDGRFTFAAPEGAVLEATSPGRLPGRAEVDALALANRRLTVALGPSHQPLGEPAPIAGKVVAKGGGPLEGALVTAAPEGPFGWGGEVAAQAATGPGGEFTLRDLPPGAYGVTARADERAPATAHRVSPGGEPVLLELEAGGRLRGCVRDARSGAPVAPFTVLVYERRSALRLVLQRSLSVVDPGGCFALDDLRPGPAAVVISAPRYAPTDELPVEIPAPGGEAVRDAALEAGGSLAGRVVDEATHRPLAGARLSVEGLLSGAASTFPALAQAVTGADGAFQLLGLPRRFSVHAAAEGHHARIVGGLETAPGEAKGPLEIGLRAVEPGEEPRTELAGVGLQLAAHGDALAVTGVLAGGGAAEAGIQRGDEILRVEGRPVTELGLAAAVQLIRGPEGTSVRLTVRRADATRDLAVPRRLVRG